MGDRQRAGDRGQRARGAHGVPQHRLDRHRARRTVAVDLPDRLGLGDVVGFGAGAVRRDEVDLVRLHLRVLQGERHHPGHAGPVRRDLVISVAVEAVAEHLRVDPGSAGERRVQALQHQHAGAFAGEDALALDVEGTAAVGGDGAQPVEPGEGLPAHGVRAAAECEVDVAGADRVVAVADGVVPGGAGRRDGHCLDVGQSELQGDGRGEPAGPQPGRDPRVHGRGAVRQFGLDQFVEVARLAVGGADGDQAGLPAQRIEIQPGVLDGHPRRRHREPARRSQRADGKIADPLLRVELTEPAAGGVLEADGVERRDRFGTAASGS